MSAACACCRHIRLESDAVYQWPRGTVVTWHLDRLTVAVDRSPKGIEQALRAAARRWAAACGVQIRQVKEPSQARVLVRFDPIDGNSQVEGNGPILGETELPIEGRADAQHLMRLDVDEDWTAHSLVTVATHEFGHALGVGHAPEGTTAVMGPYYDPELTELQPWDVAEARRRYGRPEKPARTSQRRRRRRAGVASPEDVEMFSAFALIVTHIAVGAVVWVTTKKDAITKAAASVQDSITQVTDLVESFRKEVIATAK